VLLLLLLLTGHWATGGCLNGSSQGGGVAGNRSHTGRGSSCCRLILHCCCTATRTGRNAALHTDRQPPRQGRHSTGLPMCCPARCNVALGRGGAGAEAHTWQAGGMHNCHRGTA
jgi:hypothetical protein